MVLLLIFAFVSGLVTIAAPCIWPLLPIVLSTSVTGGRSKALGVTIGIISSFAFFTLTLSYIVKIIPLDPNVLRYLAVAVIGVLGLSLVYPPLTRLLEGWVSRFSGRTKIQNSGDSFGAGLVTGAALGVVWSPCAGPILATIATLAATRAVNIGIVLVTVAYVVGVGIPLFLFALLGNRLFTKSRAVSRYTGRLQQIFGVVMIVMAALIATGYDKVLQARLLDAFPSYSNFLVGLESNINVQRGLDALKGGKNMDAKDMPFPMATTTLPDLGEAPEFTGINHWLTADGKPFTIQKLRGHVVLVDFWTYTCINCIRTLPHVTSWYEKYKDQGFVVVGVHTPEFEFEKDTGNVQKAMTQYGIKYPVGQDNDYATWRAYDNHYWPAKYLIDAQGHLRYYHFGEGEYDKTEGAIQLLLKEAGKKVSDEVSSMPDETPKERISPESYLGAARMEYYFPGGATSEGTQAFALADTLPEHAFSFGGTWTIDADKATSGSLGALEYNFYANKVYLVIRPPEGESARVNVFLDGVKVGVGSTGVDVKNGVITIDSDRLYNLIDLKGKYGSHVLRLEFQTPGTQVFAFTFG